MFYTLLIDVFPPWRWCIAHRNTFGNNILNIKIIYWKFFSFFLDVILWNFLLMHGNSVIRFSRALFNDCRDYIASPMYEWINTEHRWIDTDKEKAKYLEKSPSQCLFHHKYHTTLRDETPMPSCRCHSTVRIRSRGHACGRVLGYIFHVMWKFKKIYISTPCSSIANYRSRT